MLDIRILIIANDEEATHAYARALSGLISAHDVAATFTEAQSMAIETAYNGMLFDLVTLVRSSKEEKLFAYGLINLYPTIRVKFDNKSKELKVAPLEQSLLIDPQTSLQLFIEIKCKSFPARSLSRHKRTNICLNVLLCPKDLFSQEGSIKTFTVDISLGGAFLHTTQSFQRGDRVWLRFKDLSDPTPIKAKVCWKIEWGVGSHSIPGIGVEFEILSESQRKEIFSYGKNEVGFGSHSLTRIRENDNIVPPNQMIEHIPVDVSDLTSDKYCWNSHPNILRQPTS